MSARASSPDPVPSWSYAPAEYGNFGTVVASAGDVNGDGVDDVIIGSPYWSSSSVYSLGRAYLFLGQCGEGLALEPSWIAEGEGVDDAGAFLGWDVGSAGDVNADGFGDIFVLERYWEAGGSSGCDPNHPIVCPTGRVHVWYGAPSGPAAAADWTWAPSWWAEHIAGITAGDVNGNGVSDLAIAVPDYEADHIRIFRGVAGTGLPQQHDQIIEDPITDQLGTQFGHAMALGDVDGDGSDDLLVGAFSAGIFSSAVDAPQAGVAHLFYGGAGGLQAAPGWTRWGDVPYERYGAAVAIPGDMDGDGHAEMAISAPAALDDLHPPPPGGPRVEIFRGGPDGPANEPDETLLEESWHLTTAGDVDGAASLSLPVYDDLAMERLLRGPDGQGTGQEGVVVHGAAGLVGEMTLVRDAVLGAEPIAGAGDVNADGFDDVVVGASWYFEPPSGETTGRAWLHPGRSSGFGVVPVEPPHCCEHPTVEELAILKVYDIEFTGTGLVAVHQDTGAPYGAPHWLDAELDGAAAWDGRPETLGLDRRVPVAYVRNSVMHVEATFKFKIDPPTVNAGCLQVKGIGTDGAQFSGSVMQNPDGSIRGSFTSSMNLPNAIDSLGKYKIDWQASRDGTAWTPIGTSSSRVYVLLAPPDLALDEHYETVVDVACRSAVGCTTTACMVEKVYEEFQSPENGVKRKEKDGFLVEDGVVMQYWATEGSPLQTEIKNDPTTARAAGLLNPDGLRGQLNGRGRCGAWQELLIACFQIHGLVQQPETEDWPVDPGLFAVQIKPAFIETSLIVRSHAYSLSPFVGESCTRQPIPGAVTQTPLVFTHLLVDCNGPSPPPGCSCDRPGIRAQTDGSVENPSSTFVNHALVLLDGWLYDPSYGSPRLLVWAPFVLNLWENDYIAGYLTNGCVSYASSTAENDQARPELWWGTTQ